MFAFAQVESALAELFDVPAVARSALRARIKNFAKLGIAPSKPGKGKKIAYTQADVFRWALCFEFSEFGTDPAIIRLLMSFAWDRVWASIENIGYRKNKWLVFYPNVFSSYPDKVDENTFVWGFYFIISDDLSKLEARLTLDHFSDVKLEMLGRRRGAINIGLLWREVDRVLHGRKAKYLRITRPDWIRPFRRPC